MGEVTVDGAGSAWNCSELSFGPEGGGVLNITGDGQISVAEILATYSYAEINMATGGMLALYGDADDSLADFLGLIDEYSDAIRYWDDSIADWADITGATYGEDYTLKYITEGDLAGNTMLTVPEPGMIGLLERFA
jgi:T5SS/PEP-CTERM-associated repeat protein